MRFLAVRALHRLYRLLISPALHLLFGAQAGCRFDPSCSDYAKDALILHGWGRGGLLALRRIARCHPFSRPRDRFDPVPSYARGHANGS